MESARINGIDLFYDVRGEGRDTIVFAHGAGGNHLSWWQQVPLFAQRYRVVTFDHRGFGRSADEAVKPGPSKFIADLEALLDHLGIARAALVAQSMGGLCAMGLTLTKPERVSSLVMADTVLGIRGHVMGALDDAAKAEMEAKRSARTASSPTSSWALGPKYQARNPAGAFLYQQISDLNAGLGPDGLRLMTEAEPAAAVADLAKVTVPILFLVGEDDAIMPPPMLKAASRLMPSSRYVEIPECGHSVYFEAPEAFNAVVLDFLATSNC